MHHLNTVLAFITHHPALAYGAVFLISLSESLAIVGLIVPGTVIMFGVGAVVATGHLALKPVLLLAAAGAIAGDGISYWLGHHYHEDLRRMWPFSRYPGMLQMGAAFFKRHGGKSVLFGRFVGPVRPVIPVVAGMLGMQPLQFAIVNVLSAVGWALAYVLPGVFFGTSLAVAGAVSTRLAVLVFILLASIWGFVWFIRKLASLLEHQGPIWIAELHAWTTQDRPVHWLARPLKNALSIIFLRQQSEALFFLFLVLTLFMAGWGFLGVLQDVLAKDPLVMADQAVYHYFQSLRTPWADRIFVTVTELGDSFVNICLAAAVLLVLLGKRCYRTAVFWAATLVGGLLGVQLLKWMIHLPRPVAIYQGASAYGFPSGHATMSVILYGFLAILLARKLPGVWRWGLFSSVIVISFVIGLSRLYLGAHWLSDILGGLLIGTSWAALLGIAYLHGSAEIVPRRWIGMVVIITIGLAGSWHVAQRHAKDMVFYAPRSKVQFMSLADWRSDAWRNLPAWRIDMAGEREQPLTLQWHGPVDRLAADLLKKGWRHAPPLSVANFLGLFSPDTPVENLLSLPRLHDGRAERLQLIYTTQDKRLVLRLWSSDVAITGDDLPVFVGTIAEQRRQQVADLVTIVSDSGEYDRSLDAIAQVLGDGFDVRRVHRKGHEIQAENELHHLHWHGDVLLVSPKKR
ncbi:LssY C-terminal domain-containing protein [Desulfosarcina cetonica]|uniref:bifunctional DedA family/phosphatase PAP2 family protein n=1 Tax=Desulfosarcina cetonica TaxID=90730 RepID=UPI0006D0793D|nr:bifunctional DedA family/phosphatase PAP2 family protein [Desulfosarcina cetonica]